MHARMCMCTCADDMVYTWRSEDNLWGVGSLLPSLRDQIQTFRLSNKRPNPLQRATAAACRSSLGSTSRASPPTASEPVT